MMGWPQIFMFVVLTFGVLHSAYTAIKRRELSSGVAALVIMISTVYTLFIAYVLHAGGFW